MIISNIKKIQERKISRGNLGEEKCVEEVDII
jgi:hypothetical protein